MPFLEKYLFKPFVHFLNQVVLYKGHSEIYSGKFKIVGIEEYKKMNFSNLHVNLENEVEI